MCGIAGIVGQLPPNPETVIRRMTDTISYRGPDDDGYHVDPAAALGMRRLSIIDLQTGHQPIYNEDDSIVIVYNGEVYNYRELREDLVTQGHTFLTMTDTEVLLHQYEQDGPDFVHRLNGMFGVALWDSRNRRLVLVRDRMGIKPLYYAWDGRTLLFGSEIKTILASGMVSPTLNMRAVWDYLTFRYVPGPETIWEGIWKLMPGHHLMWEWGKEPVVARYWDIPLSSGKEEKTFEEFTEEFNALFIDSVERRLIADVPVGVLLSGVLDSSCVAAAIKEIGVSGLASFSVAAKDDDVHTELPYARLVSDLLGMEHHEVLVDADQFLDFLPRFMALTDEPLADLASIPLYYVSELARRHVTVVLSGEGSDEILAGYNFDEFGRRWRLIERMQHLPQGVLSAARDAGRLVSRNFGSRLEKLLVPIDEYNLTFLPHMTNFFSTEKKRDLLRGDAVFSESLGPVREMYERIGDAPLLDQLQYVYCQSWLVEDLLMKADRMTMGNSLELRVPFLDYRLVEWAFSTPPYVRIGGPPIQRTFVTKHVLRTFAKGRIPESIITRPKRGFSIPFYDWLPTRFRDWSHDMLGSSDARCFTFLEQAAVGDILKKGTDGDGDERSKHDLWILLILETWLRQNNL